MSIKENFTLFCLDPARLSFVTLTCRQQSHMGRKEVFRPGALALPSEELLAFNSILFGENSQPATDHGSGEQRTSSAPASTHANCLYRDSVEEPRHHCLHLKNLHN